MNQPSVNNYRTQINETRLFFAAHNVKPSHINVIQLISNLQDCAKLGNDTGCWVYKNFHVTANYREPYQLTLALKMLRYKRGT